MSAVMIMSEHISCEYVNECMSKGMSEGMCKCTGCVMGDGIVSGL